MAVIIKRTSEFHAQGVKMLVYGQAGSGKTSLIQTLPNPITLSAEGGLLSLAGFDLPYIEIGSMEALAEAYEWLTSSSEATLFESVAIDSISEIAEVILSTEKSASKDARNAYGLMQDQVADLIRSFRDIPGKHIYMTAKLEQSKDEMGRVMYAPSMPGNKTGQSLPYFFDEVLALRVEKDAEGVAHRALMTDSDGLWAAKDRSGKLEMWMTPDLGEVIRSIQQ